MTEATVQIGKVGSAKELGFFTDRRRCESCGKFCQVRVGREGYLESACCGALVLFAGEMPTK